MTYNKQDAVMTRGFAILCMVVLHLFCRTGADVFGTPLIWLNSETPLVFWFGFYAEICVSVYSICMGYAQYLLYKEGRTDWRSTGKRILKLMINYWIILILFSIIGLIYSSQNAIPHSLVDFLKSIVLIHSYNGAWWFLKSYILFLLIPATIKFFPIKKIPVPIGLVLCVIFQVGWYLVGKFGFWPSVSNPVLSFVLTELYNLIGILPAAFVGAFLCKGDVIRRLSELFQQKVSRPVVRKLLLAGIWIVLFVSMNLIHKAVLTLIFAVLSFLVFNLWEKGKVTEKIWLFLGKHSTNIWLTHFFFYATLFTGLVQKARYPLAMLAFMMILCIAVSYVEFLIEKSLQKILNI